MRADLVNLGQAAVSGYFRMDNSRKLNGCFVGQRRRLTVRCEHLRIYRCGIAQQHLWS